MGLLDGAERLPTIETERLRLRWLEASDAPSLFRIFGDAEVCRYWSRPPLEGLGAAEALREEVVRRFAERALFQWGIAERASHRVVGTCTLANLSAEHRRAELGYALAREAWGLGYAREALEGLLDFAFRRLALHRLEADVDPRNARSIRVLEGLGFTREGMLRERYHLLGEIQDAAMYGLLAREWAGSGAGGSVG